MKDATYHLQVKMSNMKQRTLGGDQLWIKPNGDCLTVCRGKTSEATVENVEGEWSKEEINMALYLYRFTEAAKR